MSLAMLLVVGLSPTAAAAPRPCEPLDGVQTSDVARARSATGSEVTEYFGAGAYRVTRCTAAGAILRSDFVEAVAVPGDALASLPVESFRSFRSGRAGTLSASTYAAPTDPVFAAQWRRRSTQERDAVAPPTRKVSPNGTRASASAARVARVRRPRARMSQGGDSCTNGQYVYSGLRIFNGNYGYRANLRQMPQGDTSRQHITKGHHAWNNTVNDCSFRDVTNITADYLGTTAATPHSYADGVNVVDFGNIGNVSGGCGGVVAGVIACAWGATHDGAFFDDIDHRYSTSYRWSTSGASGRYDTWSVAAHESGHSVGLAHARSSTWLTMYFQASTGSTRWRTLAFGDARGLRCRYGVTGGGC